MSKQVLDKFPKSRQELPEEYLKIYDDYYKNNREGKTAATSISSRLESWMHRKVCTCKVCDWPKILEIGAGTLNQLPYEKDYSQYDIVEPYKALYKNSVYLERINNTFSDISEISFENKYDKISSIAAFEHILNLPEVIARCSRLLSSKGKLCISIPNEGTVLWVIGYKISTGVEFRLKYGMDYSVIMNYEHINTAKEIREITNYFFKNVKVKNFGLCSSLALYQYYECKNPNTDKSKEYLNR